MVFLRAVTAIPLVQFAAGPLPLTVPLSVTLQLLAVVCSALLIVGLWTPIAGIMMALSELFLLLFPLSGVSLHIVLAALAG